MHAERADADQQAERPRRLDDPDDPAAPLVGHVVGGPRNQADVEHDLGDGEDEQPDREPGDARLAPATIAAPAAMPSIPPVIATRLGTRSIEPSDERRRQPRRLGDGERNADVGDVDVEAAGDRGDERRRVPVDGLAAKRANVSIGTTRLTSALWESSRTRSSTMGRRYRSSCSAAGSLPAGDLRAEGVEALLPDLSERRQPGVDATQRSGVEAVVTARAVGPHADESGVPEDPQVLRHGGLGDPELVLHDPGDRTRCQLVVDEEFQDAPSNRVAEDVEGVHQPPV